MASSAGGRVRSRGELPLVRWAVSASILYVVVAIWGSALPPFVSVPVALVLILIVPGYAVSAAIFPEQEALSVVERWALSGVLSIALLPPVAIGLDAAGVGIRLVPVLTIFTFGSLAALGVGWLRQRVGVRWGEGGIGAITPERAVRREDRSGPKQLGLIVVSSVAIAFSMVALLVAGSAPQLQTTEFYLVGDTGTIVGMTTELRRGSVLQLVVGTANRERQPLTYRVGVLLNGAPLYYDGPFQLGDGETRSRSYSVPLQEAGADQVVEAHLFRLPETRPYRTLRLLVNVADAGAAAIR